MVTKHMISPFLSSFGSVLAKIFMVTKLEMQLNESKKSSVLAKIFMVTKPQKYGSTFLNVIEY